MKNKVSLLLAWALASPLFSQIAPDATSDPLPYREIPAYPDSFSAQNVVARMVDGLGFRFYWATEGLRPEDLAYRPTPESRSSEETIDHILGLSMLLLNPLKKLPIGLSGEETSSLDFSTKRRKTLENLQEASDLLKKSNINLQESTMFFQNGAAQRSYSFWNVLNGPLADALWHVGQVVSFRRSSGNPFNPKVGLLLGKPPGEY